MGGKGFRSLGRERREVVDAQDGGCAVLTAKDDTGACFVLVSAAVFGEFGGDEVEPAMDDGMDDGMGGPGYLIPAEISPLYRHNKGSLAAARTENPERASSGSQFYICHTAIPSLDGQYTVFGETVKGLDIVDKIAAVPTGMNDRPNAPVKIISMKHINAPKTEAKGK